MEIKKFVSGCGKMRQSIFDMKFSNVYPLLVQKAERKGRMQAEVDEVIRWLTGYGPQNWDPGATERPDPSASVFHPVNCIPDFTG